VTDPMQLASLFPTVSEETWRSQVDKLLKGRSFDTLLTQTSEGLQLKPLYAADEAERSGPGAGDRRRGVAGSGGAWQILERVQHPNPKTANAALLAGLSRGATALQLILQPDLFEQSPGVRAVNADDLAQLLEGVLIDALPMLLDAGPHATAYGRAILKHAKSQSADTSTLSLHIACDPAAALARDGSLPGASEEIYDAAATQAKQEKQNVAIGDASKQILFRLSLDANVFAGAVKQRALRVLWSNICDACGDKSASDGLQLHAETHSLRPQQPIGAAARVPSIRCG